MVSLRLIVFAKAPLAGEVKTRLIPALGAHGAATLARQFLKDALAKALDTKLGVVELCVAQLVHPIWDTLAIPPEIMMSDQGEGDLGERMARACQRTVAGGESVILLGTDCPACDTRYLQAMAKGLVESDAVIARAADGGYPAIGMNRFDPLVFQDIAWSTSTVLDSTLARLRTLNWSVEIFPEIHDIDEPKDLVHLPMNYNRPNERYPP
jgi:uncharacterized protein